MLCPCCNANDFYQGFTDQDCRNPECKLYKATKEEFTTEVKKELICNPKLFYETIPWNNVYSIPNGYITGCSEYGFNFWQNGLIVKTCRNGIDWVDCSPVSNDELNSAAKLLSFEFNKIKSENPITCNLSAIHINPLNDWSPNAD